MHIFKINIFFGKELHWLYEIDYLMHLALLFY